ncbi:MAG TPA: PAS domain S-box protein, partial [Candidatus Angelobacter sp.]|nr:PAS domain S-box protein [Candidatus Angelobacter sp.]
MIQPPLTGAPLSILLLEDDPMDAELSLRKLESSGLSFSVKSIGSAEDFKREIISTKYDVILGDYRMPNWTGLEAVRWLRASGYKVPFILVTGTLGDELAVECIKEGANDYILKDKLERLPFAILRAVEESRVRDERDQQEHALSQSERQYASIIENAPYGIFRADESGRILMANPAMVHMLGYKSAQELLKLNMEADVYFSPQERHDVLKKLREPKLIARPEVKWRHQDGRTIIVRLEGRQIEDGPEGEPIYEAFVQDVTEQRLLEQQFQQAQKMEAIGRLAGGVAHDFNNLLTIITGYSRMLLDHGALSDRSQRQVGEIHKAGLRAGGLTQQLLAFSRKQVFSPRSVNMNTVVREIVGMLGPMMGEDIRITTVLDADL